MFITIKRYYFIITMLRQTLRITFNLGINVTWLWPLYESLLYVSVRSGSFYQAAPAKALRWYRPRGVMFTELHNSDTLYNKSEFIRVVAHFAKRLLRPQSIYISYTLIA